MGVYCIIIHIQFTFSLIKFSSCKKEYEYQLVIAILHTLWPDTPTLYCGDAGHDACSHNAPPCAAASHPPHPTPAYEAYEDLWRMVHRLLTGSIVCLM